MNCEKRFTTYEHIELTLPQVVKQDGKREEFCKEKLLHSLTRALHKRPVPVEFIDQAVEQIITKILATEIEKFILEILERMLCCI